MIELYPIVLPVIKSAVLSPLSVSTEGRYTVTVTVAEETKYLTPEIWYSGEIYSNEV